jgi:hypothetical protein
MKSKACQWCDDLFVPRRVTAKFCGDACRLRAHRAATREPVHCAQCGAKLERRKKYCNQICRTRAQLARMEESRQ